MLRRFCVAVLLCACQTAGPSTSQDLSGGGDPVLDLGVGDLGPTGEDVGIPGQPLAGIVAVVALDYFHLRFAGQPLPPIPKIEALHKKLDARPAFASSRPHA